MKKLPRTVLVIASVIAVPAVAQQPLDAQCSATATQATGYTPGTETGPSGNRVRGAAAGAAAGAVVGGAQGNQYDNAPDAMKDAHRQDQARSGAAAGMVVGGSRNRQERRQNRNSEDAWQKSYSACLQQQGPPGN
jgi:hypothetical protein